VSELVEWLKAQLDEDERVARAVLDLAVRVFPAPEFAIEYHWALVRRHQNGARGVTYEPGAPSPARVVAEVEAKRRIIAEHQPLVSGSCRVCTVWDEDDDWQARGFLFPCPTVRLLALPYADRPGYREEWRPSA
jgi:hypothetical protein